MEKKRSKGVIIFGWLFIVSGILGLFLEIISPKVHIEMIGIGMFIFSILISIATFVCGIFILRLHPKARNAAILLCLIGIISIPFYLNPMMKDMKSEIRSEKYYEKHKQKILEELKPEYQQKALENLDKTREMQRKITPFMPIVILVIFAAPGVLLQLIPIYYFTRPKVKEQFK